MTANRGLVVALLGAESTGKTTLAGAMAQDLAQQGHDAVVVPEYLREFCEREQRTPRSDEQAGIAAEQTRRIEAAAHRHAVVLADTSALMIAVYSDLVFGDTSLYADAQAAHRAGCDLTLLTALDLPWQADGLQRDGPQVRGPVDDKIRAALARANIDHAVIIGTGDDRTRAGLAALQRRIESGSDRTDPPTRWRWHCERCGDSAAERCSAAHPPGAGRSGP